jgi:ketosteroid isomerase-like protein
MTTKTVIQKYFGAIHHGHWDSYIADDFAFANSNFDTVIHGKAAYIEDAGRFFKMTSGVEIKQMIVEGDSACVIARYALRSPKGNTGICDVAEILNVRDDRITSSAIFFDTRAFQDFAAKG